MNPPSNNDQNLEYETLYSEMLEIGQKFPGFLADPNIFTTNFNFNQMYRVLTTPFINVDINTSTSFTLPESGDGSLVLEVSNGGIDLTLRGLLGDLYGNLSAKKNLLF